MGVNLTKGQSISLIKKSKLSKINIGLGWDPIKKSGGFLGGLFSGASPFDCDASVLLMSNKNKFLEAVYFGNLHSKDGSINHFGDNLTGKGEGDDEVISVDLEKIGSDVHRILFVVNIYSAKERKQDFGMLNKAHIRVINPTTNREEIRYNLADNYGGKTSLFVGEIVRTGTDWEFKALGEGENFYSLKEIASKFA